VPDVIDLRSDTVTLPTPEMYAAMASAPLGDDVFGDDPTVKRLEELAAERMGKEAALFVTSGTQGNLTALLSHTRPGQEIILEENCHIYWYEAGGLACVAGLLPRPLKGQRGALDPAEVAAAFRPSDDPHQPLTGLVCLENTHNRAGGTVITPAQTAAVAEVAHARGVPVHLDGARIFNAAVALGVDVRELTRPVDSVTFCLSKGLACPVGSVLCGSAEFIRTARRKRKLLGGGLRQAGVLAACGIEALERMVDRLAEDHANARRLAEALASVPGLQVDLTTVETNMVYFELPGPTAPALVAALRGEGVLTHATAPNRIRLVTHYGITAADCDRAAAIIARLVAQPVAA